MTRPCHKASKAEFTPVLSIALQTARPQLLEPGSLTVGEPGSCCTLLRCMRSRHSPVAPARCVLRQAWGVPDSREVCSGWGGGSSRTTHLSVSVASESQWDSATLASLCTYFRIKSWR